MASALVRAGDGRSDVHRARGAGPLRLMTPRAAGKAAWIVTSSLGGGLVDGDAVSLEVTVATGATCVVTTQASTKIYKGSSRQETRVVVEPDANVLVVPDAIVPYRNSSYVQTTEIALTASSTLVLADVVTCGRVAYGERWDATRIDMTLAITIDETRLLHDRVLLAGETATKMRRFQALGTAVLLGPRVRTLAAEQLAALAPVPRDAAIIIAGSPVGDGALFRVAGADIETVVHATRDLLRAACALLGEDPWSRKW